MLVCLGSTMVEFVAFGFDHLADDVPSTVVRCHAFLDALGLERY